jgi:hypothetical protein
MLRWRKQTYPCSSQIGLVSNFFHLFILLGVLAPVFIKKKRVLKMDEREAKEWAETANTDLQSKGQELEALSS